MATLDELRRRFAHNDGLPFCEVLSESSIQAVLDDHKVEVRDRVFTPQVTIWTLGTTGMQTTTEQPLVSLGETWGLRFPVTA